MVDDQRLSALLRGYDRPIEPERAFADRLYGLLALELGFSAERLPWWRRWLRPLALPQAGPLRYVWLVGMVGLLLALTAGIALVGAILLFQRSAADIVQASQAAYLQPPAFVMTLQYKSGGEERYSWDGVDALRIDIVEPGGTYGEPAGSYYIRTSTTEARYNAADRSWTVALYEDIKTASGVPYRRPFPLWGFPLTWVPEGVPFAAGQVPPLFTCPEWQRGPDETVLGRATYHVSCASPSRSVWIDQQNMLVLRSEAFGPGPEEVTEFDSSPSFTAGEFSLAKPEGALAPEEVPVSTLAIGQPLPASTAQQPDGNRFDFATLRGRPTAIYLWCSCTSGPQVRLFAQEAQRRANQMNLAIVAMAPAATVNGLIQLHDLHIPALVADNALLTVWQIQGFPALILLDAQGRVAGYTANFSSPSDLTAILDAVAADQPIPSPAPRPVVDRPEGAVSDVLEPGGPAPDWTRPRLDGGQLSVNAIRGKPALFYFWQPDDGAEAPVAERLVAAWGARNDAASLVLVARGEVKDVVEQNDWTVPVVYDWDGEATDRWGLIYYGTLVALDAEGNVLTILGQFAGDPEAILNSLASGAPLPSPTLYPSQGK